MFGQNKFVCIAGKNSCSINFVKFVKSQISKNKILILPNVNDKGEDSWQPSLKKFAIKNKFKLTTLKQLYKIKNLIFISIEFENIINVKRFSSNELYNFHFSLLPKYRGCHTNFFQIYNGEKVSGVTIHKIDNGIDTGPIIDQIKFTIKKNTNAYQNYFVLMKFALTLFKKNFKKLLNNDCKFKKQKLYKGSYYSRSSIDYDKMKIFNVNKINAKTFNRIKAFIFPPLQLPIVNNKNVKNIKLINKKYKIYYD